MKNNSNSGIRIAVRPVHAVELVPVPGVLRPGGFDADPRPDHRDPFA